jgi:YVTN family beta-propeller protein
VYVSTGRTGRVLGVDTADTRRVETFPDVGARPWGIAISRDGKTLFTANGPSNDVSVIDVDSHRVVGKIPVGAGPWGLALIDRSSGS